MSVEMTRRELLLDGLCCPNCAAKIEREVAGLAGVRAATLDFATSILRMELADGGHGEELLGRVTDIVHSHEPDIVVSEKAVGAKPKAEGHDEEHKGHSAIIKEIVPVALATALFVVAMMAPLNRWVELALYLVSYLIIGGEVLLHAGRNILRGRVFDENFLMSLATIGAFAVGQYPEGVAVMLFYRVGEFLQERAVDHSRRSIRSLMDIRPDYANLVAGSEVRRVAPEEVAVGDRILIRPGERVPLDGVVVAGESALDTSALTGESLPRDVFVGSDVLSGSINSSGLITVEVSRPFGESTVNRILELTQNATGRKAQTENFITKFAGIYTPAVVIAAVLLAVLPPLLVSGATFSEWINRALVFLVVSCPCALVISIPLSFFGGIGGGARRGILIKGSSYLEALNRVDTVVFDKTGTLTEGRFTVAEIVPAEGQNEAKLLEMAAYAESYSSHPIAQSILAAYGRPVQRERIADYRDVAGHGVHATIDNHSMLLGNLRFLLSEGIPAVEPEGAGVIVHLAVDGQYAGYLRVADQLKKGSRSAIDALRMLGVRQIAMLTGDRGAAGEEVGRALALDRVYSELLPDQKVEKLEELLAERQGRGKVVFVGDGINDAPVLARADVGVAMGALGSDAAIEAADVVLMTDEPTKLADALRLARRTRRIVVQNVAFALGVKGIILVLGALGIATMWEAVFGDVGVALLAILNAMRLMRRAV